MSEGCPGCFTSAKGVARELETIRNQARQYAKQEKTTVVIYKEADEFRYVRIDRAAGLPVMEYISAPE